MTAILRRPASVSFGSCRSGCGAKAYADTAWLTHCATGPSDGWEKLLAEYYSWDAKPSEWRECLMLKRLGFSDAEIARYMESACEAETFT